MVLRERERKARTTLLMAIPEDHLAKFHKMTDGCKRYVEMAKKSRFVEHDGIHKGYERFQSLLSQLEIHGAGVSTKDANQKFLRSLPSAWLQVSLILCGTNQEWTVSVLMTLYKQWRVFENDVKGSTASSSNLQNIAFVSENTNSTNEWLCIFHENIKKVPKEDVGKLRQFAAKEPDGFDKTKWNATAAYK
ncbi:hypothetical protein Tco_0928110 [Tanacetum coccineum]